MRLEFYWLFVWVGSASVGPDYWLILTAAYKINTLFLAYFFVWKVILSFLFKHTFTACFIYFHNTKTLPPEIFKYNFSPSEFQYFTFVYHLIQIANPIPVHFNSCKLPTLYGCAWSFSSHLTFMDIGYLNSRKSCVKLNAGISFVYSPLSLVCKGKCQ